MRRELDWETAINTRVRVYRNLNNGLISVQRKIDKRWPVVGHIDSCVLRDVRFHVSEASRQRAIRENCKNVHAWGEGLLVGQFEADLYAPIQLGYDHRRYTTFVDLNNDSVPIESCRYLVVRNNVVWVSKPLEARLVTPKKRNPILQSTLFFFACA